MDNHNKPSKKTSKIPMILALMVSLVLPYYLVKTFSGKHQAPSVSQQLTLPNPGTKTLHTNKKQDEQWTIITINKGDSLANIFKRTGISTKTLNEILKNKEHSKELTNLKTNQQVQLLVINQKLQKMIIPISTTQSLEFYQEDNQYKSKIKTRQIEMHEHYLTATVHSSLYSTAKRLKIPQNLIAQMAEIFGWQVDFAKDIRDGDRFTIIYKAHYIENQPIGAGEIVAVTLTNRGKTYQAIHHINAAGSYDYFTPEGKSLKKAFDRYPIKYSHISSMFSMSRNHPILHSHRPHKGVDLAAPLGTPIRATGDGRVSVISQSDGYGKMIKITHYKNYTTIYAHLLRFQKGISRGSHIIRGEVIGYVGQSGLATGPHLHYEFHLNNTPRNPTTIDLPRGSSIPNKELAAFRINASTLLSHLNLYEEASLASAADKNRDLG